MTAICQLREAWSELVRGARSARISPLRRSSIGSRRAEREVGDEHVARVERQVQALFRRGPRKQIHRRERPVGLGRGKAQHGALVDELAEELVFRNERRPALGRTLPGERPDLRDALRWIHAVEVEGRQRKDLAGRAIGVPEDLGRVRRLTEEVAFALAGLQAAREIAHASREAGRANGRRGRRRQEQEIHPERQHGGQCSGCPAGQESPKEKAPVVRGPR